MTDAGRTIATLKRRRDFLRAAGSGVKFATGGLVLQACRDPQAAPSGGSPQPIRVGFTASKKVGGAVQRNRARRRLRALAREVIAAEAAPGHDYVLIARPETVVRDFAALRNDLRTALKRLRLLRRPPASPAAPPAATPPAHAPAVDLRPAIPGPASGPTRAT